MQVLWLRYELHYGKKAGRSSRGCQSLMWTAMSQLYLSVWAYHRILTLACTSAGLAGSEEIQPMKMAEALQYRPKPMLT